jgi:hypothetical protein
LLRKIAAGATTKGDDQFLLVNKPNLDLTVKASAD